MEGDDKTNDDTSRGVQWYEMMYSKRIMIICDHFSIFLHFKNQKYPFRKYQKKIVPFHTKFDAFLMIFLRKHQKIWLLFGEMDTFDTKMEKNEFWIMNIHEYGVPLHTSRCIEE